LDKEILVQYCSLQAEIRDLHRRIQDTEKFLADPPIVGDVVKGTRKDGTIGPIKITGIPDREYGKKKALYRMRREQMKLKEEELLELTCQVEEFIESLQNSELRTIFRLYFIDGYRYTQVAKCMNDLHPERDIKYTDENVKKKIQRFFNKF